MTISPEESVWSRSYAVWSQLAVEPPSSGHGSGLGHDIAAGDPMIGEHDPKASPKDPV